jgi:kumamolisin
MSSDWRGKAKLRKPLVRRCVRAVMVNACAAVTCMAFAQVTWAQQPVAAGDSVVKAAEDSEAVQFVLTLPLRNRSDLASALKDIYNPISPRYHHFLSPAEFRSKYAPTEADYAALKKFAADSGLTITGEHAGRTLLDVSANVDKVHSLFKSQMYWRQTKDGRPYLMPDVDPAAPAELSAMGGGVAALRQKPLHPFISIVQPDTGAGVTPAAGSGPSGSYEPSDLKTAYNLGGIQNGGTPVALVEFSSATYSDAAVYASQFGLNNPALTQVAVDGGTTDTSGNSEVLLDIEMVMAASNAANIYVYTAPNTTAGLLDTYTRIADDNLVSQVSTSWGICEADLGSGNASQENQVFTQMAAQGMAVFAASGDFAAYGCDTSAVGVEDPASQPYVTGVGGTTLNTTSAQGYVSESVWYNASPTNGDAHEGGGGGISAFWSIPSYQTAVVPQSSQFSTSMRNVPDVALDADPNTGFYIYCSTCTSQNGAGWGVWGGTSAAAPLWAAFWSLVNKGLATSGGLPARAGFANPSLYSIAEDARWYALDFHDVTSGGNGYYNAVAGYDNASGWGSYNGGNLYQTVIGRIKGAGIVPVIHYLLRSD